MAAYAFNILLFPGLLFGLLMGLVFTGVDRKVVARMQRRIGPSVVQPFYDTVKLFAKETVIPARAPSDLFAGAPVIALAASVTILLFIPIGNEPIFANAGDMVVILYLLAIPAVCSIVAGSASGSSFSSVGLSREMVLMIACEIPIAVSLVAAGIFVGKGQGTGIVLSLSDIAKYQLDQGPLLLQWKLWPAVLGFLLTLPGEAGKVPFDLAEAETEICEGIMAEYGGRNLAVFQLAQGVKMFALIGLFVAIFTHGLLSMEGNAGFGALGFVLKCLAVLLVCISWVRASVARIKIEQAVKYFWTYPLGLSLLSMVLVWLF